MPLQPVFPRPTQACAFTWDGGQEVPEGKALKPMGQSIRDARVIQAASVKSFASPRLPPRAPTLLSGWTRMLNGTRALRAPASVDGLSHSSGGSLSPGWPCVARAGTRPRAPPRPTAAGAAAGTKAARVWAGRRVGSVLGPALLLPTGRSLAARGAPDSHAAGLLLARRRRAGGELCGRERPQGPGGAASPRRRPSAGPRQGAARKDASGSRPHRRPHRARLVLTTAAAPAPG